MIEQLARSSSEELRTRTTADVEAGLADLHVRLAHHRRRTGLAVAAAIVFAAGLGAGVGVLATHTDAGSPTTPSHPGPTTSGQDPVCIAPRVDCLGDRTYRFALNRPVEWTIPPGFGVNSGAGASATMVESYREAPPTAGVTVLEDVRASSPDGTQPASAVDESPRAFVRWVAARRYLDAGEVIRTTLDGHPAWQVRVTLARGAAPGQGVCTDRYQCHAITFQPGGTSTGIWGDMAAEYTAIRLPGAGMTVVWSWMFTGSGGHLGALEEAVHGLSWPTA